MIAEEETNKETITVLTTDQTIDLIMVLDLTMAQDPTTVLDLIMDHPTDRATDPLTDQRIHLQINYAYNFSNS